MVSGNVKYKQFIVNGPKHANVPDWFFTLRKLDFEKVIRSTDRRKR